MKLSPYYCYHPSTVVLVALLAATASMAQSQSIPAPDVYPVDYTDPYDNNFALQGYLSTPSGSTTSPVPGVVLVPSGLNVGEYDMIRATMIQQELGYVGFAADLYGPEFRASGAASDTVQDEAFQQQFQVYLRDAQLLTGRIQAAIDFLATQPSVDATNIAIVGYGLGGTGALLYTFMGATSTTLQGAIGAVSVGPQLTTFPVGGQAKLPILTLSGAAQTGSEAIVTLENNLKEANATWQITRYSGAGNGFYLFATEYHSPIADQRQWRETSTFLQHVFGQRSYGTSPPDSTNGIETIQYDDNGFALTGYMAVPPNAETGKTPAIIIVPDWDGTSGPDGYEAQRATLLAQSGSIGFVADIYGADVGAQLDTNDERGAQASMYRDDPELFVGRIQAAVNYVTTQQPLVNPQLVYVIGYCFGGTGAVNYAFAGKTGARAVVPFHGGLTSLAPIQTDQITPYTLIQSGGIDDAHGDPAALEQSLSSAKATWEIARYSGVVHGFTQWSNPERYNARADWRSWDAMIQVLQIVSTDAQFDTTPDPSVANVTQPGSTSTSAAVAIHRFALGSVLSLAAGMAATIW